MSDDHLSLAADAAEGDGHWAFGTGFEDPLHGVDTTVPEGVDTARLAALCLALGDDALVSAQRLGEWVAAAPELEIELALANIGLDLLGQTRLLYARAGLLDGTGRDEDAYAYFRDAEEFRNLQITELPNGDFAYTVLRLLAHSAWRLALLRRLVSAPDPVLAAIAAKGVKELAYHRQFAADWAIRLGDGTEESHRRMTEAARALAPRLAEFRRDESAAFLGVDASEVAAEAREVWERVLDAATLEIPEAVAESADGRKGEHTAHLAPLLAELQVVARAHPGARW
jgi:ring-1,2-phenylacetyl-CoA epoxidase subunit PaaC